MNETLYQDARQIVSYTLKAILPDQSVRDALRDFPVPAGRTVLVAAGKAAWQMTNAALSEIAVDSGIVITKYGHSKGPLPHCEIHETGHPVLDENSLKAAAAALSLVGDLNKNDTVLFLLSGGASALFELPLVPLETLQDINRQLLECGASITEINTIRKRLSAVKGGRFALKCAPAKVFSILLSDILGDPLDMIGSGPAYPDSATCGEALEIVERYGLKIDDKTLESLKQETPKKLENVTTVLAGNISILCQKAEEICRKLGYETRILDTAVQGEAKTAGKELAEKAVAEARNKYTKLALIEGGETVVVVRGHGLGGRNQELVLAAVETLAGQPAAVFSLGSDGTDGPTDAAGAYADGDTLSAMKEKGIDPAQYLADNDSYHAFEAIGQLLITGPTGTNINDLTVALIDNT
ncbi:MAG: glycerate kinase [Erysipelotrichaceae bacterium]|nr:glycerate kinase [Erysipelotrichaceae bacterium]